MMEILEIDANWLFQDETKVTRQLDTDEKELIDVYRNLNTPHKKAIKKIADYLLESEK